MDIIETAINEGRNILSEHEATSLLASYGVPTARQLLVHNRGELAAALSELGYPLVLKGCSPTISHKTEKNLVHLDVRTESEATAAYDAIVAAMNGGNGAVLVQEMIKGGRELVVGLTRDPQFGPCVMFGLGGIFTEILKDVAFRLAPLEKADALDMMRDIRGYKILDAVRGMEKVDQEALANILINIGRIGVENERVKEIDINPVIIRGKDPVAVDALVVLH